MKIEAWNRFVSEGLLNGQESNTKFPFSKMTKKFGLAYIEYLKAAWQANDNCLSEAEFLEVNGGAPLGFFNGKIRNAKPIDGCHPPHSNKAQRRTSISRKTKLGQGHLPPKRHRDPGLIKGEKK